ncbi:MAG: outer membrane beta-barrel domain-containing protein, partial [Myxococcaceae bacterium]|nr:outer membrane beta-barrel domain-containing protein [Myxococcaceae bacterium]
LVSGAGQICTFDDADPTLRGCRLPTFEELDGRGEGQIRLLGGADVQWAPIYGKLSLLAESFAHFDLYAVAGVAAVQYAGPDMSQAQGSVTELTFGGNVGVGAHFFLTPWLSLRTELRDLIYPEKSRRLEGAEFLRNQFLFELGLSVFLPSFVEDR